MLLFTLNLAMPWDFAGAPNARETATEAAPVTSLVATVAVAATAAAPTISATAG